MNKTRLILIVSCAILIFLLFQLPKSVVENENEMVTSNADTIASHIQDFAQTPVEVREKIAHYRALIQADAENEKNAIFADSLAALYNTASQFDSAGWYAEVAARSFNDVGSWLKAADSYYQAYTLAVDPARQATFAGKAQEYYQKVLTAQPRNLDVKTKMAMTYLTSPNPMQGITMLREVLQADPKNEGALFNMGMLSIQSGQYDRAIERLEELLEVNPDHIQGNLLLGIAWMNKGETGKARQQFEKVKRLDRDPAVQATVDSYLEELK